MAVGGSLQLSHDLGVINNRVWAKPFRISEIKRSHHLQGISLSSCYSRQDIWGLHISGEIYRRKYHVPYRYNCGICRSIVIPTSALDIPLLKSSTFALTRSCNAIVKSPLLLRLAPALGVIVFAVWGLGPVMRYGRNLFYNDSNWKKSRTHFVFTSYLQPILLWTGATLICRALDPIVLPSEASQAVKQRLLSFVKALSTVLAFAYCLSSLIQQTQKLFMEKSASDDARNMGFQFAGRAVYTAVWIAAVSLFMELLGFSTQKWLTAGGLGTVLLTLAGREIFTNFLSSVMIHATRPFIVNEWIQTKIEGYEVSGTVEHVGWWSPTVIRGEDREAVHIPNHKFTVNVVRNLSQKTHWRIKTHLAISHLDVNKIGNIVADMRKVLAKNPQIEQQRLHRRVFLDNINPESQALLILISCFVKTSHFEEYLCVKEAVILDLLRVISHHRARLATPIRTVQKIYGDAGIENIPFADTIFTHADSANRRLLLIEPSSRINGDEKTKLPEKHQQKKASSGEAQSKSTKIDSSKSSTITVSSPQSATVPQAKPSSEKSVSASESLTEQVDGASATIPKSESDRSPPNPTVAPARPSFEDNIVLGVALEGSKRTLPIEEGEDKEVGAAINGNGAPTAPTVKDRKNEVPNKDSNGAMRRLIQFVRFAMRDLDLVKRIGAPTALQGRATGIPHTFAPCIAVCRDPRWGRCFESYSEDHKIVQAMTEIIPGLQGDAPANYPKGMPYVFGKGKVAVCAKHFVGDGGTQKEINENNTIINRFGLLNIHMPAYYTSIAKGVSTIMVSYSSWNGVKMHANQDMITGFLKKTLNFKIVKALIE